MARSPGLDVKEREPFEHVGGDEDDDYYSPKCAGFSSKILAKAVNFVKIHSENIAVSDTASLY